MYVIVFWKKWSSALFWISVYFSVMDCVAVMFSVIESGRGESNYSVCCACVTEVRGSDGVWLAARLWEGSECARSKEEGDLLLFCFFRNP